MNRSSEEALVLNSYPERRGSHPLGRQKRRYMGDACKGKLERHLRSSTRERHCLSSHASHGLDVTTYDLVLGQGIGLRERVRLLSLRRRDLQEA